MSSAIQQRECGILVTQPKTGKLVVIYNPLVKWRNLLMYECILNFVTTFSNEEIKWDLDVRNPALQLVFHTASIS